MMAQELLVELKRRGIKLRLTAGDRLDVVAPAGSLTPELRDDLRRRRDNLIALLRGVEAGAGPAALTPRPELRHEPFPLTDIQHAYWVGRSPALELGGVSTHVYFELDSDGLDLDRAQDGLRKVIDRHDMLRAVIGADGVQRVLPEVPPYAIATADLRGLPAAERDERLAATRREMDHQVLPADRWPLFDIRASRIGAGRVRLHVGLDTLILDGYSLYLLFQDWRRFYEDPGWTPEPLAVSYRDHVLAEQAEQDGPAFARARDYWLDRLADLPGAPALPLAAQPSRLSRTRFSHRGARMDAAAWRAVKRRAQRHGLTPSAVLMTAYADVLRHWSDQPDFTLDLTLFNRPQSHPEIGRLIGDFTSVTLLAVTAPERDEPFAGRARLLQSRLLRDLEHSSFSGVRVMRERNRRLGGGPGASMPVVFTSALVLGSRADDPSDGLRFFGEQVYGITQTPQVWLDHQVSEEQGELIYNWDAVEELFPAGLLDDMFGAYRDLIGRLARDEDAWERRGAPIGLPAGQERERAEANATAVDPPDRTLCDLVEEQARRRPDAPAVICGDATVSYREVLADAYRLAGRLRALGAGRGTLVAVVLPKGAEQVAAVLGVTRSGAAYLPIDPQWPQARREQLIDLGRVRVVLTSPRLRDELAWPSGVTVVTPDDPETRACAAVPPDTSPAPGDLAYVIFTSGSTGTPKGVMIDHRGAVNTVLDINRRFAVGPDDRVLALSALTFDLSVYDVFGMLAAGGTVVMPSPAGLHDPEHWSALADRHRVTVWNTVPALMQAWTDAPAATAPGAPALRLVLLSGDWIPVSLPALVRARHGAEHGTGQHGTPRIVSLGGATEASIWSVWYPIGEVPPEWTRIPYGKPLDGQTLHVYGPGFVPRPVWAAGEIYIGGTGVAQGYWADPDRTAAQFVTHPRTGARLYRTGDRGRYLPGGDIEFLGREDHQVKVNGYRIELGEIEAALRRLDGVGEALVMAAANPRTGGRQLVAHVLPAPGAAREPAPAALRAALDELLPAYLVPRHYVRIDAVPLSANGKVDRAALPLPWDDGAPTAPAAPRGDLERTLLGMWHDALGRDDFGVDDNFFELGGDSLHAVRILTRIRQDLRIEQEAEEDLEMLFDNPTIAELATTLRERTGR